MVDGFMIGQNLIKSWGGSSDQERPERPLGGPWRALTHTTTDDHQALKISLAEPLIVEIWFFPVWCKVAAIKTKISAMFVLLSATVATAMKENHSESSSVWIPFTVTHSRHHGHH